MAVDRERADSQVEAGRGGIDINREFWSSTFSARLMAFCTVSANFPRLKGRAQSFLGLETSVAA